MYIIFLSLFLSCSFVYSFRDAIGNFSNCTSLCARVCARARERREREGERKKEIEKDRHREREREHSRQIFARVGNVVVIILTRYKPERDSFHFAQFASIFIILYLFLFTSLCVFFPFVNFSVASLCPLVLMLSMTYP